MYKVLVTGATGFIGNYVVEALLDQGCTVVATSSQPEKAKKFSWFDRVVYRSFDLGRFDKSADYYKYFDTPDAMIHLAWEGLPNYKSEFHLTKNLPRHREFLFSIIQSGLRNLTVAGTCFEYGMQEGRLSEEVEAKPANPYSEAKNTLRRDLELFQSQNPFALKWIRLFYMHGKGQNPNSILAQLERAIQNQDTVFNMSGGEQLRDYLPVETVALYIVRIALQTKVQGVINCCSGTPISIKELVSRYLAERHYHIKLNLGYYPYPDYEPMAFWGDNTKLKTILNNE